MKILIEAALLFFVSSYSFANVVGTDAQNFNPTSNGLDFVTVQSGRTLDPGIFNFGVFLNYAVNTLAFLDKADPQAVQNHVSFNDRLLSSDFNFGLGLTKKLDVGFSLPFLLRQDIQNDNQVAYFAATGNTEQRLNAKYKFYEMQDWANAFVLTVNRSNIQNDPFTGNNPGLTYGLEYATSWKWSGSWWGLNFGHRWRNNGASLANTFGVSPLPNTYTYSAAWSRLLAETDTKLIVEVFGSSPDGSSNQVNLSNRQLSNLEVLAGLKHTCSENIALHLGAGTQITQGFGTPDWRVYAGLNWTIGPIWRNSIPEETKKQLENIPKPTTQRFILTNLRFKFDSDQLEEKSLKEIEQVIQIIKATENVESVLVEGHTDSMGRAEYNLRLSERRALAIKMLIATQVPLSVAKVEDKGYGASQPVADNSNYQGRAKNRRVVVVVYSRKTGAKPSEGLIEIRLTE